MRFFNKLSSGKSIELTLDGERFLKKKLEHQPREIRGKIIEEDAGKLSLRNRCKLLGINRGTLYYEAKAPDIFDIDLLNMIPDNWERYPFYGYRRITKELRSKGNKVNHKRVQRLMSDE